MLTDLLANLATALINKDKQQIEKAYRMLERVGMDRTTAIILLKDKEVQEEVLNVIEERIAQC